MAAPRPQPAGNSGWFFMSIIPVEQEVEECLLFLISSIPIKQEV
ncbi:hypothetical protein [Paenibacillus thiaminolyticus]|nr:hypothetical protein [Paenibacillus thiaminolyticus]